MAEFMVIKVDNSKKAAIQKGKWKNPGAKLYDQLRNAIHCKGNIPTGAKELDEAIKKGDYMDWDKLLKEAYMVAPTDKIANSPYGVTPFSRSGCKYPHHVIKDGKLVVSIPGLRSAYITARNQGVLMNHTSENKAIVAHFNRHFKELGLRPVWHHGEFYLMEEHEVKIEENFHEINLFLMEQTGINLFGADLFEEASHGKLNTSFRTAVNVKNGHIIKIVFDLKPENVLQIGDHANQSGRNFEKDLKTIKNIRNSGSADFSSQGIVKAIVDMDTKERLQEVTTIGIIGSNRNTTRFKVPSEFRNKALGDDDGTFSAYPVKVREQIAELDKNPHPDAITYKVGEREPVPSYKSTRATASTGALYHGQWKPGKGTLGELKKGGKHITDWSEYSDQSVYSAIKKLEKRFDAIKTHLDMNDTNTADDVDDYKYYLKKFKELVESQKGEGWGQTISDARYYRQYKNIDQILSDLEYSLRKKQKATQQAQDKPKETSQSKLLDTGKGSSEVFKKSLTDDEFKKEMENKTPEEVQKDIEELKKEINRVSAEANSDTDENSKKRKTNLLSILRENLRKLLIWLKKILKSSGRSLGLWESAIEGIPGEFLESVIKGPSEKSVLSANFNDEVGDTTPQALWDWMNKNISYDKSLEDWRLKSAAELYTLKKGNCHDQSYFTSFILHSWHYDNWQLFFVEFKEGSEVGGNTHTLTYYLDDGKYYWFENAWEDQAGIHGPFDSKEEIKQAIMDAYAHDNDLNSHEFDGIVFGSNPSYRLGMNLWDYCQSWHLEEDEYRFDKSKEEAIKESFDWIEQFVNDEHFRESVKVDSEIKSVSDLLKKFKTPDEFLEWMDCIEYGWLDQSGTKCGTGEEDDSDHMWAEYKLQSPLQLIRSKVGVCWDQCELERAWFEKQKYPFAIIYMEIDDDEGKPSHTFLIFKEPGETSEVSWFEHSWGQERGIHKFSDIQQCLLTITQKFRASQNLPKDPMTLNKLGTHPPYGIKVIPYMDYAHKQFAVDMGDLFYDEIFNESTSIFQSGDFDQYKIDKDDLLDSAIEDFDEATIGEYKNGVLRIPVSNTKYNARVEQLIRRYNAPIESSKMILVIRGREDFINCIVNDCGYTRKQAEKKFNDGLHGYVMVDDPLQVQITERKYAIGGFNKNYEMLVIHECTHSVVNSIPRKGKYPLTENFQEGIAIYESGMLSHMIEQSRKKRPLGGRYYHPFLRPTLQVRNIIKEKGYNYLVSIIKGSIPEPTYDDFMNESAISRLDEFNEDRYFDVLKSDLDNDYKSKGQKSLSDFTKMHITKELTKKFKDQGKLIKWMRDQDPQYGDDCFLWVDDEGDYVGAITYDQRYDKDHHKWISGIDVAYKYNGYGIGKQILEEAIKAGANALSVQKDNLIALRMYEKRGFKITKESEDKVLSGKSVTYDMFLPTYDPPLSYDQLPEYLKNDPVHAWRAKTGIELIHKEPTVEELQRIWENWQLMSDDMKKISDEKSFEFFDMNNEDRYHQLMAEWRKSCARVSTDEPISESWIIVEDNLEVNLDQWKPGNPLWITGASGDGKSTLAESIAKEKKAIIVTSDIVLCRMGWTKEKFEKMLGGGSSADTKAHKIEFNDSPALDYVLSHPELPYEAKDPKTRCFKTEITNPEMIKFYQWLLKELHSNPKYKNKLYLVEGCDICLMDPKTMASKPLIVVGGSRLRSLYRRAKRDAGGNGSIIKSIFKYLKKYAHQRTLDDNKDSFRKAITNIINENTDVDFINMITEDSNDLLAEESEEKLEDSIPKKTDSNESSKNGVRRKKLYVTFIEWAKEYNSKNTFGSIFDKDIFHNVYPFVPNEMRYFYRLANPILCVLAGDLTFFQVSELKRLNAKNDEMNKLLIFAATPNDLRVFNKEDKRVYIGTENNGKIELGESVGDTFDLYLQKMINKGDILNSSDEAE